ncbi:MAG: hypothetical protein JXA71_05570, partial [Chitinispirillaceae bacterium]|nr:hypothetical protein [Chitinispirillaceae bacterium]
ILRKTAVYVAADHGFDRNKTTHHNAPDVFLASSDPAIAGRGSLADITPTILHRLGVSMNEATPQINGTALSVAKKFPFNWLKRPPKWLTALYTLVFPSMMPGA